LQARQARAGVCLGEECLVFEPVCRVSERASLDVAVEEIVDGAAGGIAVAVMKDRGTAIEV